MNNSRGDKINYPVFMGVFVGNRGAVWTKSARVRSAVRALCKDRWGCSRGNKLTNSVRWLICTSTAVCQLVSEAVGAGSRGA